MTDGAVVNSLGQPVGFPVPNWKKRPNPSKTPMEGRNCRLEALNPADHAQDLFDAFGQDQEGRNWTYLPYGPFSDLQSFRAWLDKISSRTDPLFYTVIDHRTGHAVGIASYLRIDPENGSIEVGHIHFSPALQRSPTATEAMYLMMRRVFEELRYRRYEWKCDSLNEKSRAAAARLGFRFEGVFRQSAVYKGRNRDTAWFSIIDSEWPKLRLDFERWLDPGNFDAEGNQREKLSDLTKPSD